jgi:hypothetical protein
MPTAVDQSWSRIDPVAAAAAGVQVVMGYLSHDPSKNWTPEHIRAYHAHGIGCGMNWESDPGRPLLGAPAGAADATNSVAQLRALIAGVGYAPRSRVGVLFSCDRDTNPGQYGPIDAYYRTTKLIVNRAGVGNGTYGEFDLVNHLSTAGLVEFRWQTLAWSGGQVSPYADLYQSSINNTLAGASVDYDQIRHPATLGVWWPPGSATEAVASGSAVPITAPSKPTVKRSPGMYEVLLVDGSGEWFQYAPSVFQPIASKGELVRVIGSPLNVAGVGGFRHVSREDRENYRNIVTRSQQAIRGAAA